MSILRKMLAWFRGNNHTRRLLAVKIKPPVPGEVWELDFNDPFGLHRGKCVVMEVKDGWVRYRFVMTQKDWALKIGDFIRCYTRSQHQTTNQ